jgi:peptidoglycan/xylan/chitin deacetylase (PgdA/CDA1 family)
METFGGVASQRLAAFSIDVEPDYGGHFGKVYNALLDEESMAAFQSFLESERIPATLFVTGDLLDNHGKLAERTVRLGADIQAHSYNHPKPHHDVVFEARLARDAYVRFFGREPSGYRSPYGYMPDSSLLPLGDLGYRYDSSLFPTYRPGRCCNLNRSLFPRMIREDFWELPLGCFAGVRLVFSVGYLKYFGASVFKFLLKRCGVPSILIIDSHMHDFIPTKLYRDLPPVTRFRYSRNRDNGMTLLSGISGSLRAAGYRFVTVDEIHRKLRAQCCPKQDRFCLGLVTGQ